MIDTLAAKVMAKVITAIWSRLGIIGMNMMDPIERIVLRELGENGKILEKEEEGGGGTRGGIEEEGGEKRHIPPPILTDYFR